MINYEFTTGDLDNTQQKCGTHGLGRGSDYIEC